MEEAESKPAPEYHGSKHGGDIAVCRIGHNSILIPMAFIFYLSHRQLLTCQGQLKCKKQMTRCCYVEDTPKPVIKLQHATDMITREPTLLEVA